MPPLLHSLIYLPCCPTLFYRLMKKQVINWHVVRFGKACFICNLGCSLLKDLPKESGTIATENEVTPGAVLVLVSTWRIRGGMLLKMGSVTKYCTHSSALYKLQTDGFF